VSEAEATTREQEPVRLLRRSRDDRMIAGVAAGLGRYFDINPAFYRIGFVVLALVGGAGILIYAAAALVIPNEGTDESIAAEALRNRHERPWTLIAIGLMGLAGIVLISHASFWPNGDFAWILLFAAGAAIIWAQRRETRAPAGPARGPGAPDAPAAPRRPSLFLPVVGLLVAAAGVLALLDALGVGIRWDIAVAVGAVGVGVAVAVGGLLERRTAGLFWIGVLLALLAVAISTIDVNLEGRVGARTVRPAAASDLEREYHQAIGNLTLDLGSTRLPPGATRVEATVGIGELRVLVPPGVAVKTEGDVSLGDATVLRRHWEGVGVDANVTDPNYATADRVLVLDAQVGVGHLQVDREAA
jgi:phage shock protein PspC (stress-responsive transcriptional regulator)